MTTYVIYGDRNFDTCYTAANAVAAPSSNATLDIYNINGAKLIVDTDTRYAPGRNGSVATAGTGAIDTVTISSSLGGELLIDGTKARIIPYKTGSGTPAVQSAGLYTSSLSWASGVVTAVTSAVHSLTTGDFVAIGGAEPNGYNGVFQVTVTNTTTFTYELVTDPGISTVTNATAVKYWHVRQLQGTTKTVSAKSFTGSTMTYTATGHGLTNGTYVLLAGITPAGHNGYFQISNVQTDTFDVTRTTDPGTITVNGTAQVCAQGYFLGFWSAFNVAGNPTGMAVASAVTATGFLKVKNVTQGFIAGNTVTSQSGSVTCVAVTPDMPGWIEVCGASAGIMTVPRLGKFTTTGEWFNPLLVPIVTTGTTWSGNVVTLTFASAHNIAVGSRVTVTGATVSTAINGTWTVASTPLTTTLTFALNGSGGADTVVNVLAEVCTSGVANQQIQLPAATALTYYAGVWIETSVGSGTYEFWPSAGSYATAGQSTNAALGKVCWISTQGLLRFGHDGTQANGYNPVAGLRIRIPNIMTSNTTRAASPGVGPNIANTATMTARETFVSSGGNTGIINIDKTNSNWYLNFVQTSSVTIQNSGITEGMVLTEIATPYTLNNIGIGQSLALSVVALTQTYCFAGGTETNCTWTRTNLSANGNYVMSRADSGNITITGETIKSIGARGNNTTGAVTLLRDSNCTWTNTKVHCGQYLLTSCSNLSWLTTEYADSIQTTAITTFPQYIWSLTTVCSNIKMDGITFAGSLTTVTPYNGILGLAVNCSNIKLRNMGSAASPTDLGSRSAYILNAATGCSSVELKRLYSLNTRTGVYTVDNSINGVIMENVWGDEADSITGVALNMQLKGIRGAAVTTGQTAVYGAHIQDFVYSSNNTGKIAYTFNEKTAVEPSNSAVTLTQLALPSGFNSVGVVQMPLLNDEITITTPYYMLGHSSFTVAAPTWISTAALASTASSWSGGFTTLTCGTHGLSAGDTVVITGSTNANINGVFVITNIVSATQIRYPQVSDPGAHAAGNILPLDNINAFYYLDTGSGYGTKRNLKLTKTGGVTTNASPTITMTSTAGIEVGDYVTSKVAGAGASTRVTSIDSATQVTVNVNSSATTAGNVLYFNHLPFESALPAAGFKLKLNLKNWAQCNIAAITNLAIPTVTSSTTRAYQYALETVPIKVSARTIAGTAIVGAQVLLTANTGSTLPFQTTVTIANSGTTATVTHTGHGLSNGDKVLIKGASLAPNNGVFAIVYIDANSYSYTMDSSPGSSPTGTIKATYVFIFGVTDSNGDITENKYLTGNQPVTGWARKSTDAPFYKTGVIFGTASSTLGITLTALLIEDQ